jgi:hypothetical protein
VHPARFDGGGRGTAVTADHGGMPLVRPAVRRVAVPSDLPVTHYVSAFRMAPADPGRTAASWARGVFEDAPSWFRPLVVLGWRRMLGLRLTDRQGVLGWRADIDTPDRCRLVGASPLLDATNEIRCGDGTVLWITTVQPRSRTGRLLWAAAAPPHHLTIPWLLRRAARRNPGPSGTVAP